MSSFTPVDGFTLWRRARAYSPQEQGSAGIGAHKAKVYKSGVIGVTTRALNDIGARRRVVLLYNEDMRSVALMPAEDDDPESFAISRNGENNNFVSGKRLLDAMGWRTPGVFPARVEGDMLIIDLREESALR